MAALPFDELAFNSVVIMQKTFISPSGGLAFLTLTTAKFVHSTANLKTDAHQVSVYGLLNNKV